MTTVEYVREDCLRVAADSPHDRVGVLVYASHKRFGGGYRNHSKAQEEYLFNNTTLPRQKPPEGYYPLRRDEARGFSLTAEIKHYQMPSREVVFIFVPAPVWREGSDDILWERAALIYDLARKAGVEHLVLGGWGCGVFGCPPDRVSRALRVVMPEDTFERVTYAFLDNRLKNAFEV